MSTAAAHRASRIALYADWLQHDADGLAFNLTMAPADADAPAILTTARDKLRGALDLIETAIATTEKAPTQ
ncbi:hypothetical protein ONR75_15685 [Rhodopseudomonas sp. P2A-2r]|uniref:hypothetical protein n=1 Tax=Rhodopseudomonas sp. P2A-2r TaxID=2991972 RepID=UPI002233FAA1|nr:hypothetical protein [Rhodopseudomonas sp. P2A-2r]UZE51874.1 hypothetical protein ONR75_15685 [Rhodopseudomonas sp. P2A-2r]